MSKEKFISEISEGYTFEGPQFTLGGAMFNGECQTNCLVNIPMRTMNRHGLIAGATGAGKTKTLQIIAEQLSAEGVPVLMMDIKGDLSGIAAASEGHPKIDKRHEKIGIPFNAGNSPIEFLTLSGEKGARLRATVSEFGPVLFSKILELNDTQSGIVSVIFKYCDDKQLPLLDLKDMKETLKYVLDAGKEEFEADYGKMSSSSIGTITRKIIELEQQGADLFFGERSFEIEDLIRRNEEGKGIVSVVRLTDIQDKPKLFSTFMLQMLAEIYATLPEQGDADKPRLVMFIDEAHLVFNQASDALQDQLEAIVKLIRSKGVGLFFVTQNPDDIPESILGQLGMKIQHALRAFTAKDRKAIKLAAQNYPISEYYDTEELLTSLGIGEAFVTVLNEKGIPTPLVHCLLRAPQSRMDILTPSEIDAILATSEIIEKYNEEIDRESAYEVLKAKIEEAQKAENQEEIEKEREKARKSTTSRKTTGSSTRMSTFQKVANQIGRTASRELTRGLLGALGIKSTRRRRSNKWF